MEKDITPESLNRLALKASLKKYRFILSQLEKSARKGKNGIIINHISEVLINKLQKEGYFVIPILRVKSTLFFGRKKTKCYIIKFIQ